MHAQGRRDAKPAVTAATRVEIHHIGDLRLVSEVAPIAADRLARDVARFVGGEESSERGDVLGSPSRGVRTWRAIVCASTGSFFICSVRMTPGEMALQRTPWRPC